MCGIMKARPHFIMRRQGNISTSWSSYWRPERTWTYRTTNREHHCIWQCTRGKRRPRNSYSSMVQTPMFVMTIPKSRSSLRRQKETRISLKGMRRRANGADQPRRSARQPKLCGALFNRLILHNHRPSSRLGARRLQADRRPSRPQSLLFNVPLPDSFPFIRPQPLDTNDPL